VAVAHSMGDDVVMVSVVGSSGALATVLAKDRERAPVLEIERRILEADHPNIRHSMTPIPRQQTAHTSGNSQFSLTAPVAVVIRCHGHGFHTRMVGFRQGHGDDLSLALCLKAHPRNRKALATVADVLRDRPFIL
jgi:hypothetical protein